MLTRLRNALQGTNPDFNDLADQLGAPHAYVICPNCGAQAWRLPPHPFSEACPLVKLMAESLGLKFDAERMLTLRSGNQVEQVSRFFDQQFGEETDDE